MTVHNIVPWINCSTAHSSKCITEIGPALCMKHEGPGTVLSSTLAGTCRITGHITKSKCKITTKPEYLKLV